MNMQYPYTQWVNTGDRWILKFKPYYEEYDYAFLSSDEDNYYSCGSLEIDHIDPFSFYAETLEEAQKYVENSIVAYFEQSIEFYNDVIFKLTGEPYILR